MFPLPSQAKHNPSGYKEPKNISTSFRNKETSSKSLGHWLDIDLCWNLELGLSSVDGNSFPVESPWKEKSSRDHFCRPSRGAVLDTKIVTWRFSHCSREQTPERFIAVNVHTSVSGWLFHPPGLWCSRRSEYPTLTWLCVVFFRVARTR